jgi:hypothetical protein
LKTGAIDKLVDMATLREWRRPPGEAWWALVGYLIGFFVISAITIGALPDHPSNSEVVGASAVLVAVSALAGFLGYRVFAHSCLRATDQGILVANPFRSDQFVTWGDIASIRPERLLIVRRTDGRRVVVWAVQKNGWHRLRQQRAGADATIDELSRLASIQLAEPREFSTR